MQHSDDSFSAKLQESATQVNRWLADLTAGLAMSPELRELVDYTLCAPGKRIRAVIIIWIEQMLCGQVSPAGRAAACAVEMVHTYSLVHDDLPAMDDDDMRRGRPTCHKAFDEASAILAGDALLTLAFEVLVTRIERADLAVALTRELASAAGPDGMIAGQMADLQAENKPGNRAELDDIHLRKTARMFACAARMGALCGGAQPHQVDDLGRFGLQIGLGFQISDDILDVKATTGQLGKTAGKDVKAGKLTYPSLVGIQAAQAQVRSVTEEALQALAPFGSRADLLRDLALALLERQR